MTYDLIEPDNLGTLSQGEILAVVLANVRRLFPAAVTVDLHTSDSPGVRYGYTVGEVTGPDGTDLRPVWDINDVHPALTALDRTVRDQLSWISWGGVVGEDSRGDATITLTPAVEPMPPAVSAAQPRGVPVTCGQCQAITITATVDAFLCNGCDGLILLDLTC